MATEDSSALSSGSGDYSAIDGLEQDGKNTKEIRCERCSSLVLRMGQATMTKKQMFLPFMRKKNEDSDPTDGATLEDFWVVPDMFTFENVGFSNTVGTTKYLICADCETGPIGWHDVNNKKAFYIALERVKHS